MFKNEIDRTTGRQTDRQTDRQTEQTEQIDRTARTDRQTKQTTFSHTNPRTKLDEVRK